MVLGRYLLDLGGNETAARLASASVRAVKIGTFMICSLLAGLAGMIVVAINSASDAGCNGELVELNALAAVVVGGALLQAGRAPVFGAPLSAVFIQLVRYTLLANWIEDELLIIAMAAYLQQGWRE